MDDRSNTIAMMVLGAGIVALGSSIVFGEVFHQERPEKMGYPIEGVEVAAEEGAEAEQPIAFYLATADAAKGEQQFKKCAACHSINQGGASGIGPNLWANMGAPIAHVAGFAYSDALKGKGGNWDWQNMSDWLKSPKAFAPGTKMTFAGISNPQDRANLLAYMNTQGSNLPLPAAPEQAATPDGGKEDNDVTKAGTGAAAPGPQKAENEPVLTEQQLAKQPEGNTGGEGAPAVTGNSQQERDRKQ